MIFQKNSVTVKLFQRLYNSTKINRDFHDFTEVLDSVAGTALVAPRDNKINK